ncbi:hypothetical protein ACFZDJ_54085 [Streptomyces sp. NPDC007896]|uniref:hypothetical protein n=1 Tax=Streptomyces sp. NPDC007896 TaxID=3364784 RepID=UPI0036E4E988
MPPLRVVPPTSPQPGVRPGAGPLTAAPAALRGCSLPRRSRPATRRVSRRRTWCRGSTPIPGRTPRLSASPAHRYTGTPVHAYYDDRADGAWIFYTGVTGSGLDPDRLHDILYRLPAVTDDGAGDRTTTSAIDAKPGPHGGRAICNTVLIQTDMLATAVSTCSWFTPTTATGITLVSKADGTSTKLGFTAVDVAPIIRAIRSEVEIPRQ